jgi:hypothetical protein
MKALILGLDGRPVIDAHAPDMDTMPAELQRLYIERLAHHENNGFPRFEAKVYCYKDALLSFMTMCYPGVIDEFERMLTRA